MVRQKAWFEENEIEPQFEEYDKQAVQQESAIIGKNGVASGIKGLDERHV